MKETPKYLLIASQIKQMIQNGDYQPNDQLPKEFDIAKSYNVSRITVRNALQALENEGFIYRIQGAGTYVKDKEISQMNIVGNLEPLNTEKFKLKLVDFEVGQPAKKIAKSLELNDFDIVYTIKRNAYDIDNNLVAFQSLHIPAKVIQGMNMNMMESSIYPLIAKRVNHKPKKAKRKISLTMAADELLENAKIKKKVIEEDEPLLKCEQQSYLSNDEPFEFNETYYRISKYPIKQIIVV